MRLSWINSQKAEKIEPIKDDKNNIEKFFNKPIKEINNIECAHIINDDNRKIGIVIKYWLKKKELFTYHYQKNG